jgi:hypothetical protein
MKLRVKPKEASPVSRARVQEGNFRKRHDRRSKPRGGRTSGVSLSRVLSRARSRGRSRRSRRLPVSCHPARVRPCAAPPRRGCTVHESETRWDRSTVPGFSLRESCPIWRAGLEILGLSAAMGLTRAAVRSSVQPDDTGPLTFVHSSIGMERHRETVMTEDNVVRSRAPLSGASTGARRRFSSPHHVVSKRSTPITAPPPATARHTEEELPCTASPGVNS